MRKVHSESNFNHKLFMALETPVPFFMFAFIRTFCGITLKSLWYSTTENAPKESMIFTSSLSKKFLI